MKTICSFFVLLALLSCKNAEVQPERVSIAGKWQLHAIVWNATSSDVCVAPQVGRRPVQVTFTEKGFTGQNVVNFIRGNYTADITGMIKIDGFGSTKIAGTTDEMICEERIADLLVNAFTYKVTVMKEEPTWIGTTSKRTLIIGLVDLNRETFDPEGKYLIFKEIN